MAGAAFEVAAGAGVDALGAAHLEVSAATLGAAAAPGRGAVFCVCLRVADLWDAVLY